MKSEQQYEGVKDQLQEVSDDLRSLNEKRDEEMSELTTTMEEVDRLRQQMTQAHSAAEDAVRACRDGGAAAGSSGEMDPEDWMEKSDTTLRNVIHKVKSRRRHLDLPLVATSPRLAALAAASQQQLEQPSEEAEPQPEQRSEEAEPQPEQVTASAAESGNADPTVDPLMVSELLLDLLDKNAKLMLRLNGYRTKALGDGSAQQHEHSAGGGMSVLESGPGRVLKQRPRIKAWPARHLRIEGEVRHVSVLLLCGELRPLCELVCFLHVVDCSLVRNGAAGAAHLRGSLRARRVQATGKQPIRSRWL